MVHAFSDKSGAQAPSSRAKAARLRPRDRSDYPMSSLPRLSQFYPAAKNKAETTS